MRRNESAATTTISRVAVRKLDDRGRWDPLLYSAEIATAGMLCAILTLVVIAVL
jgi:hypothetical protein